MENISNIKKLENGFISFTREITWLTRGVLDFGWGNGYVGIPQNEKELYGKNYDDIDVSIHGGLTYSEERIIEGVTYWVIGFDTVHAYDTKHNWDEEAVIQETDNLLNQVLELCKKQQVLTNEKIEAANEKLNSIILIPQLRIRGVKSPRINYKNRAIEQAQKTYSLELMRADFNQWKNKVFGV